MPTIDIIRLDENPYVTVAGIRDDTSSRGVDLDGALITATYTDGTSEELVWQALDPYTNGGVTGANIDMFFGFEIHELTTTKRLASLEIDLAPASSVFDTTTAMDDDPLGGSTLTSKNGFPFKVGDDFETLTGEITATYSGIVNLSGEAAVGDLFTTMLIDFSGLPDGGLLGDLDWNSDIDTMETTGDLVSNLSSNIGGPDNDTLTGSTGPDTMIGMAGDDTISGGDGDDTIFGDAGDDAISGGDGSDTAGYSGARNEFTIQFEIGAAIVVEDRKINGEGIDALTEIERLSFADDETINLGAIDGVVDVSSDDLSILIEVYIAYFNRAPDALGLYFWASAYSNGVSLPEIAALFLDQDETRATYPSDATNLEFATQVYSNVLGRTPDNAGLLFWQGQLDDGNVGRDTFILEVLEGAKADAPASATQDFIDLQQADQSYLATKTDIGTYFSAIKGLSDVTDASAAMEAFLRSDASSLQTAVDQIDGFYEAASAASDGEMLIQLVGIVDDPFAVG